MFRNEFLEKTVGSVMKAQFWPDIKSIYNQSMYYFDNTVRAGGPCYATLDYIRPSRDTFLWFHPCRTKDNVDKHKVFYNLHAFFHPTSPWLPIVEAMDEEMFQGYNTIEEKAQLVADIGWVFGPKLLSQFSKVTLGSFSVFTRRSFEFPDVRNAFVTFMNDERTKDLPVAWNVFCSHHVWDEHGTIKAQWENWHDNFNVRKYPKTIPAYLSTRVQRDTVGSWENNPAGSFMSGNSDRLFPVLYKGDGPYKLLDPNTVDYSGFEPVVLIKDICDYNLTIFNQYVRPYVQA
jgi:hypothetical protein